MPRALSRDEQAVLAIARRAGGSIPVPELAAQAGLTVTAAQTACEYLVSRALLRASIYAVSVPETKAATAAAIAAKA